MAKRSTSHFSLIEEVEAEVLLAEPLADAYDAADGGASVVYAVLLGVVDELEDERRHAHDGVGVYAAYGVPLQFGDAVADTYHRGAHLADAEEVGQTGHEALVHGGHELHDVAGFETGALEAFLLVVGQALQVFLRAAEGDGVAQGAAGGYVVYDFLARAAEEVVVEELQVFLLGEGNLYQVLKMLYLVGVDAVAGEHALVVRRVLFQVLQRLVELAFLKGFYLFGFLVFDICHNIVFSHLRNSSFQGRHSGVPFVSLMPKPWPPVRYCM